MSNFFRIGMITSAHGIKGAVKVFPTTEDPQRFRLLKTYSLAAVKKNKIWKDSLRSVRYSLAKTW